MTTMRSRLAFAASALMLVGLLAVGMTLPAEAEDGGVIALKSGETREIVSERVLVGNPLLTTTDPNSCRGDAPEFEVSCDVYRVELELSEDPDAVNFFRLQLDWETQRTPPLQAVAAGLVPINTGDLDIAIFDVTGEEPVPVTAAGAGEPYKVPEIAAFEPRARAYDVMIFAGRAPVLGYTLTMTFSDELFGAPFEALDPAFADGSAEFDAPVDNSSGSFADASGSVSEDLFVEPSFAPVTPVLPEPAIVGTDTDFTGFQPTIDNQLTGELASFQPQRGIVEFPVGDPPGAIEVLFWLLLVPLLITGFIVFWLRRRSTAIGS